MLSLPSHDAQIEERVRVIRLVSERRLVLLNGSIRIARVPDCSSHVCPDVHVFGMKFEVSLVVGDRAVVIVVVVIRVADALQQVGIVRAALQPFQERLDGSARAPL